MVSSTDLPTGRSFIVICLRTPWGLIMKRPLSGIPASSPSTSKCNETLKERSCKKKRGIEKKFTAERTFDEHTIFSSQLLGNISNNRDLHVTKATFVSWSVCPGQMGEFRVTRSSNNLGVDCLKVCHSITESDDLSWANKSKIKRIKEQDDVFSAVV